MGAASVIGTRQGARPVDMAEQQRGVSPVSYQRWGGLLVRHFNHYSRF